MNVRPIGNRVLIEMARSDEKSPGGILLPENVRDKSTEALVRALGTGGRTATGEPVPFDVGVGDRVLIMEYCGDEISIDGNRCKIINASDIVAVIQKKA